MKNLCIMITSKFPYDYEETFIENEITYLANSFKTVYIIVVYADKKAVQTRRLPPNVQAIPLGSFSLPLSKKILLGVNGILRADKDIWREVQKRRALGWKTNSLYMYGSVLNMVNQALTGLNKTIALEDYENCVLYSYWFSEHALLAKYLAVKLTDYFPTSVISRAHRNDLYLYCSRYQAFPYRDSIFHTIDAVFPCSEDGTNHLSQNHPQYSDKIKTAYLGTTDHGLNKQEDGERFVILTCSAIVEVKRMHLIAEALGLLLEKGYDKFLWVCIGDGPLLPQLKEQVAKLSPLGEYVEFLGTMQNKEVMNFYKERHVDLLVNVSASEGLPVSVMEAQSFGVPCFATDVGGTSEIVSDEVGRLLSKDVDPKKLAKYLMQYMDYGIDEREEYRQRSRQNWATRFDAHKNFQDWAKYISSKF